MKITNKNINVPNALSILRILLIIPFVILYTRGEFVWAVVCLVLSGLSDLFDGIIARRFHQQTEVGQMLDPIADKLTQGTVAICLAIQIPVLLPLLAVFVLKELLMLVGGMGAEKEKAPQQGHVVRQAGHGAVLLLVRRDCGAQGDLEDRDPSPGHRAALRDGGVHAVCALPICEAVLCRTPIHGPEGQH